MRVWSWFLFGGLVYVAAHALLPVSLGRDLLYVAVALSAVGAIVVGVRTHRPARRLPWVLLAVGVLSWAVGDLIWSVCDYVLHIEPFPSVADAFYLVGYPALAGCLYQISRVSRRNRDHGPMLDSLVVGVVIAFVLWVAFVEPTWTGSAGTTLGRVVSAAYSVGDVILLVQVVHLTSATAVRSPSLRLITGAFALTLVGDVLFQAAPYLPALEQRVSLLDTTWLVAYVLLGAAALHPSIVPTTAHQPSGPQLQVIGLGQFRILAAVVLVLPATVIITVASGGEPPLVATSVAGMAVLGLVTLRMTGMARRMTEQAERLARLADADVLTGLVNRRRFIELVAARLTDPAAPAVPVLLVVLDRFSEINDTLGHRVGDELLRAAADRMTAVVDTRGLVARVGGDSFAVLVEEEGHCTDDSAACAGRLRGALVEPFVLSDVTVSIDALVGVAVGPGDGTDVEELLQRADVALSVARERPDRVAHYSGRMPSDGVLTPHLISELPAAMEARDVVVHYQPQVEVATGRVLAVEALVRWQHPVHGMLPPAVFIPAAERTGLIRSLTLYVLDRALAQSAQWRAAGRELTVAVNLSARNLLDPGFVEDVHSTLVWHAVAPAALDLEITETMAMVDPKQSLEVMRALHAMGVQLSVDDFGTGFSSLSYLQHLPLQHLKIDRSFVMRMVEDEASAAIVRSTIELARNLGMTVVAEGVEDDATLLALRAMGCDTAQGFGLGRPVPGADVLDLVATIEHRVPQVLKQRVPIGRRMV